MTFGGYAFRVEAMDAGWWRFHNHEQGGAKSFDFQVASADPALLAARCEALQSAPDSTFVLNAVAQRYRGEAILQLRGRVLRRVTPPGTVETELLASADQLVAVLAREFDLDLPEAATLWPRICARHEAVMAAAAASPASAGP
jgi:N-hydroxyarylamine O-acetyltransferase